MKIIDFDLKGNMVRFYLGQDQEVDYHGDDWDDTPYECNAGTVYEDYIVGTADLVFPYDVLVLEPCCGILNSRYCKDDMKSGIVPCIIAVPAELAQGTYQDAFDYWANSKGIIKFYFNDRMEPTTEPALFRYDSKLQRFCRQSYTTFVVKQHSNQSLCAGGNDMQDVPLWQKANLTIPEAAAYFGIGQNRISELTRTRGCDFVLHVGNKRLIKRKQFEIFLEGRSYV